MHRNLKLALLLGLLPFAVLTACSSAPVMRDSGESVANFNPSKDPYWQNPRWDNSLIDAIQSVVHDPVDTADTSAHGIHGTVKFTFANGTIEYPAITASTGNPDLDKLMLHQVATARVPPPTGLQTDQPHEFELDLDMPTPFEAFQSGIYGAFNVRKIYPLEAVVGGYQGIVTIGFDYLDGKLSNIVVTRPSHYKELDKGSLGAIARVDLPPTPAAYAGKTLHMEVSFCYALGDAKSWHCPIARDVIVVAGTRIKRG